MCLIKCVRLTVEYIINGSNNYFDTQSYFRETSLLPHLTPLLLFPSNLPPTVSTPQEFALQFWEPQKRVNAGLVVGIIGMLISGKGGAVCDSANPF